MVFYKPFHIGRGVDPPYGGSIGQSPLAYGGNVGAAAPYAGVLEKFSVYLSVHSGSTITLYWNTYSWSFVGGRYYFQRQSAGPARTIPSGSARSEVFTWDDFTLNISAGHGIGICITGGTANAINGGQPWNGGSVGIKTASPINCNQWDCSQYSMNSAAMLAEGYLTAGPPDACQISAAIKTTKSHVGYGTITLNSTNCAPDPDEANVDLLTPWGTSYTNVTIALNQKNIYDHPTISNEHWSVEPKTISCSPQQTASFEECHWLEGDIRFVKTTGDDNKMGYNWDDAFATIDKAASVVPAPGEVWIGFGNYNESNITPTNIGSKSIKYRPSTVDAQYPTGAGTVNIAI